LHFGGIQNEAIEKSKKRAFQPVAVAGSTCGAGSLRLKSGYGSHEVRSREGEGVWFILNPGKKDLTA
jgi:hypothetical protein